MVVSNNFYLHPDFLGDDRFWLYCITCISIPCGKPTTNVAIEITRCRIVFERYIFCCHGSLLEGMLPFNSICIPGGCQNPLTVGTVNLFVFVTRTFMKLEKFTVTLFKKGPMNTPKMPWLKATSFKPLFCWHLCWISDVWAIFTSKVPQNDEINCKMDSHTKWEDNFPKAPVLKLPNSLKSLRQDDEWERQNAEGSQIHRLGFEDPPLGFLVN